MARKPDRDPPSEGAHDEHGEPSPQRERLGPLMIERLSKEDGRALILYSTVEPPTR